MGRSRRSRERVLGHLTELRELPLGGGPSDEFRHRLRDELLAARASAPATGAPAGAQRHAQGSGSARRRRRARPWLSQLATLSLAAGMMLSAFSTYRSVPGDTLYPLKRAAESTLVRLSGDDVERAERELDSAKARAEEVSELLGSSADDALVTRALRDMEESTRSGISRLERVRPRSPKIKTFAKDQRDMVEPMLEHMADDDHDKATGYLDYIEGLVAPPG
ncbi:MULTISPECIES: DUF5667 domain-containing protein [unclassified Nonomuraea]|uniref:DUF5667 domain-containing protein n=1 Tax=unclassified Nonomuraea TaxID=2593643 RepID=UPI0033D9FC8F